MSPSSLTVLKSVAVVILVVLACTSVEAWCSPLGSLRCCGSLTRFQQCALVCLMCKFSQQFDVVFSMFACIFIYACWINLDVHYI